MIKVFNFVVIGILFYQLEWNILILVCFGMPF